MLFPRLQFMTQGVPTSKSLKRQENGKGNVGNVFSTLVYFILQPKTGLLQ